MGRKWNKDDLIRITKKSRSLRQIIKKLGLIPAGGNYDQIKKFLKIYKIKVEHLKGKGWSKNLKIERAPKIPLESILVRDSDFQSFKLKKRLFKANLKKPKCELCGWSKKTKDGRIPVELDHVNGDHHDNRLLNLRILCPNCHSLQLTHRGKNMGQWRNWYTRNT